MEEPSTHNVPRGVITTVIVASLGYFVDLYDLVLFGVVRTPSLKSLGFEGEALVREGEFLLNVQMLGLLLGGVLWGVLGDKKGRLSALFSTILLYSTANLLNAFVLDVHQYAALRFIAGVGLAGELGVGITLVSEIMSPKNRGYGTMLVATFGVMGAVAAGWVGGHEWNLSIENWRVAYLVGGGMGLILLVLRLGVLESEVYQKMKERSVNRGDFLRLFTVRATSTKYFQCIAIGLPIWYVIGLLIFQAPEFAKAQNASFSVTAAKAVMFAYIGMTLGDLTSGVLGQALKSRKKSVATYLILSFIGVAAYLYLPPQSETNFYALCVLLGVGAGYPAALMTLTAEQFGSNIRATATTTAPNFIRASLVPMTLLFQSLRTRVFTDANSAYIFGATIVGLIVFSLAFVSLYYNKETYAANLDFYE